MIRRLFILFGLLVSFNSLAQNSDSVVVLFEITDQDGTSIDGVRVAITQGNSAKEVVSDTQGEATCKIEKFGEMKARFWHPDYSRHTFIEEIYNNSSLDTLRFQVTLTSLSTLILDEVVVTVPGVPKIVFESKLLSVQDFEITDNYDAVLLTYPKQLKKGSKLLLYDMISEVKDSLEIEGEAIELTRDYEGHIYLIHAHGCARIIVNGDKFEVINVHPYYFQRYLAPIVGTTKSKMFFSTYDAYYPAFDYFYLDVVDSSYTKFASVIDKEMMEEYRAEYRFVDHHDLIAVRQKLAAKNMELQTGIDAEVIYGRQAFTSSIYYEPPYAPMFKMDKYLFLFDYQCDTMKIFDDNGKLLSEKSISHDQNARKKGWKKNLLHDRITNKVYALYEKGGFHYLHRINLTTGELKDPVRLHHRYAEAIQVVNGKVYYIYRPFESYQKKYFWMEKLPKR